MPEPVQTAMELGAFGVARGRLSDNYDVAGAELRPSVTEGFAHDALNTVAVCGLGGRPAGDCHAEARRGPIAGSIQDREVAISYSGCGIEYPIEFPTLG